METIWKLFKHLRKLPNSLSFRGGREATEPGISRFRVRANARPGMTRVGLKLDPLAAIGTEQMQFFTRGNGADSLADGGRNRAGNPHDHLAWSQLPGIGGYAFRLMLPG